MKKRHPKYIINKGDTVQSVTRLFEVAIDTWKKYHNNMCPLPDVVWDALPDDLEEIFLLPELWSKEDELNNNSSSAMEPDTHDKKENVSFGYDNTLPVRKQHKVQKYGVSITIENGDKKTNIKYSVSATWLLEEDRNIVEISQISPTYINNLLPDLMADSLAADTFGIIYPIAFELDRTGQMLDIYNFSEVQQKWEKGKYKLKEKRQGNIVDKYITMMDHTLSRKDLFLKKIRYSYLFHSLFVGIYQTYTSGLSIARTIQFPFQQEVEGVKYTVDQSIDRYLDKYGMVNITLQGNIADGRSVQDFEYRQNEPVMTNSEKLKGTYYARYFADSKTHLIDVMRTECTLNTVPRKKITIKASRFE